MEWSLVSWLELQTLQGIRLELRSYIMQMIASETSDVICSRTVKCTCGLRVEPVLPLSTLESRSFLT